MITRLVEPTDVAPKKKGGRPKTSVRDDVTVKLDREVAEWLRSVAVIHRRPLAEVLTEMVRPHAHKAYAELSREIERRSGRRS